MMCMLDWILSNLKLIVSGILVIISVIVFILRKANKYTILDNSATFDLISFVNEAEAKFGAGHGDEKLRYVIEAYCKSKGLPFKRYIFSMVKILVEKILSTPQKK